MRSMNACLFGFLLILGCSGQMAQTMLPPENGAMVTGVPYFLPVGYIPITLTGAPIRPAKPGDPTPDPSYQVSAVPSPTAYIADTLRPLFLAYQHRSSAEDHFAIHIDANGLLQSVSTTATDQSPQIALKVVELIGQIAATAIGGLPSVRNLGGPRFNGLVAGSPPPPPCLLPPFSRSVAYFPGKELLISIVDGGGGQTLRITVALLNDPAPPVSSEPLFPNLGKPTVVRDGNTVSNTGVAFRRQTVRSYRITFHPSTNARKSCGLGEQTQDYVVTVPDTAESATYFQDMSRGTFVTKKSALTLPMAC